MEQSSSFSSLTGPRLSAVAISGVRLAYLTQLAFAQDVTYEGVKMTCWSMVEVCAGISCACLATLRPLVERWHSWLVDGREPATSDSQCILVKDENNVRTLAPAHLAKPDSLYDEDTDSLRCFNKQSARGHYECDIRPVKSWECGNWSGSEEHGLQICEGNERV